MPFKYPSLEARLLANTKVVKRKGMKYPCYMWIGKLNNYGYGMISRREGERMLSLSVHKVAFTELAKRRLKPGHEVSHICHHEACWNPQHLVAETHKQNVNRDK